MIELNIFINLMHSCHPAIEFLNMYNTYWLVIPSLTLVFTGDSKVKLNIIRGIIICQ